ncbi:MAG: MFS transporter [Alphaproteobacteria bacterium]|nr:MFS transporter [Alphaproteobacteria bacterium]
MQAAPRSDETRSGGRSVDAPVWSLAAAQTIIWAGVYYMFPAMLLRFETATGWSKTELTAAFTLAIAVSAVASPLAGRLIDRGRGAALLAGCAAAGGLLVAALALAESYWVFTLIWLLLGLVMAGGLYIPCFSMVTRARGAAARGAITRITLIAGLAGTLSFPSAHWLSETIGWRETLVVFGAAVLLIAAPLAWFGARRLEREHAAHHGRREEARSGPSAGARRRLAGEPVFWLLAAAFASLALVHGVAINHLLPILDERGVAPALAVLTASAIGPMQVAGRLLMLAVERRVSSRTITAACFLALIGAMAALLGAAASPLMLIPFAALLGAGAGVTSIMKPVITRDLLGEADFGAVSGALGTAFLGAFALAPFAGSLLWTVGGYGFALSVLIGAGALGLAAFLFAARRASQGAASG